jgi:hypothetical protein
MGFRAKENGVRYSNAVWKFQSVAALFWSSTPRGNIKASSHGLNLMNYLDSAFISNRSNAFATMCLKN